MNVLHYMSAKFGKRYVWSVTVFWLVALNVIKGFAWSDWLMDLISSDDIYGGLIMMAWLLLRTTSFAAEYSDAMEKMSEARLKQKFSIWMYIGYTCYVPVYQHGPPLIYERYATMCENDDVTPTFEDMADRFVDLFKALLRIGLIYLFTELVSHYIYTNVIMYNPEVRGPSQDLVVVLWKKNASF